MAGILPREFPLDSFDEPFAEISKRVVSEYDSARLFAAVALLKEYKGTEVDFSIFPVDAVHHHLGAMT